MIIRYFLFLFGLFLSTNLVAQEVLVPVEVNLQKKSNKPKSNNHKEAQDTLKLPFFDDFTNKGPYPDSKLWADSFVFINSSFGYHPMSFGVATFDALDQYGKIYEEGETNYYQFEADFLTSLPIRLDSIFYGSEQYKLQPEDSVILSFYYQPQGKGIAPIERDSLVLQFYRKNENSENEDDAYQWVSVWSATGESLESFAGDDHPYFKRVMIPIEDENYFRKDFRFRFMNYASFPARKTPTNFAGNTSIWNIDYLYLDAGRSHADTFYYDIAFVEPAQSALRNYTAMPWRHYIESPEDFLRSRFDVVIRNLDDITYNYIYRYFITDQHGDLLSSYSGGTWNIAPFHEGGYQTYEGHANPLVIPNPFPTGEADEKTFFIYHAVHEGTHGDDVTRNDTIVYKQEFSNYYAYDDGVPEAGYGLSGWNPMGAYRFVTPKADKLESVSFFFNHTQFEQNQRPFHLMVWSSLDPEEVIYESDVIIPEFEDGLFEFVNYPLSETVSVVDTFYVGWAQLTSDFINLGFDVNNNAGNNIFFNVDGNWQQSMFSGALMIRPFFQQEVSVYDISDNQDNLVVYPNPARGGGIRIKTSLDISKNSVIRIFDINGRLIIDMPFEEYINIENLPAGTYILRVISPGKTIKPSRFTVLPN